MSQPYSPPSNHTRVRLTLAWDGSAFQGWQSQAQGERTLQDTLHAALLRYGPCLRPVAAGRTDAGVHALEMTAHVDVQDGFKVPPERLPRALNLHLPGDLRVLEACEAPANFHARHSCSARRYVYRVGRSAQPHPLERARSLWILGPLDLEHMTQAANLLVGRHDFAAFATREERQTVRDLHALEWVQSESMTPTLELHLRGESFLRHMVRAIVGTLLEVGQGKRSVRSVSKLLESGTRTTAGRNVDAHGLYFAGAEYGDPRARAEDLSKVEERSSEDE